MVYINSTYIQAHSYQRHRFFMFLHLILCIFLLGTTSLIMCFWFVSDEMEADITENYQDKVENVYNSDETHGNASETEEKGQRILDLLYTGTQPGTFSDRRRFLEWGHFDIHSFIHSTPNKGLKVKNWKYFFLDTVKTAFQMRNLAHRLTIIRVFFSKITALFRFSPTEGEARPFPREHLFARLAYHGNTTIHCDGFFFKYCTIS